MPNYQTLKGFRDFLPAEKRARDFVVAKVVETFNQFGFDPMETPTLEYAALLLGKYGDEADKLVYTFTDRGDRQVGLRYDQTVPTARVLAQYQNELPKYFRRYQIQNVFRADKPQKGRYREFTQCDIDIFGSTSYLADAEILACTYFSYSNVGFPKITLKLNHRQTLITALSPFATDKVSVLSIIQSIDKLDKMPKEAVISELSEKGLGLDQASAALTAIENTPSSDNLNQIIQAAIALGVPQESLVISPTLARGLDYYTGMIFEVILPDYASGSCGGGGRYDHLIHDLGGPSIPAVGIAFGFDRMVQAAMDLKLIPEILTGTQVMVSVFDSTTVAQSAKLTLQIRQAGINAELFPGEGKLDKQFKYADQKHIPLVIVIGPEEIAKNTIVLKNMRTGTQTTVSQDHQHSHRSTPWLNSSVYIYSTNFSSMLPL